MLTGTDYSTGNILGGGQWFTEASILPELNMLCVAAGLVFFPISGRRDIWEIARNVGRTFIKVASRFEDFLQVTRRRGGRGGGT
jgi:hypothetical protein